MPAGKILRIVATDEAAVIWSPDAWASTQTMDTKAIPILETWHADLPTDRLISGAVVEFTFQWKRDRRWEGKNFTVVVE